MKTVYVVMPVCVNVSDDGEALTVYVPSIEDAQPFAEGQAFESEELAQQFAEAAHVEVRLEKLGE
jgi:hypothetical protein